MELTLLTAGVDEVGRGPLAGPVVAAAVILNAEKPIDGLRDSKQLAKKRREYLAELIKESALSWALGRAEVEEIDSINILQASLLAMRRAVQGLHIQPEYILVDGNRCPEGLPCASEAIIKGDQKVACISAASIIAKVARDNEMEKFDIEFPGYGFAEHSGYPTRQHLQALQDIGVSPIHRRSFRPVANALQAAGLITL